MNTTDDLKLPNIPIKILRRGNKLQLKAGDFTLELNEIPGKSQTYPLLVLDKFITEATTVLLKKEINRKSIVTDLRKLVLPDETQSTDNVIQKIHDIEFGEK